jgi:cytochrome c556
MRIVSIGLGLGIIGLAAAAVGQTAPAPAPAKASGYEGAVIGRKAGFLLSAANFGAMKGAIDRGDDVKSQAFAARSLARWAKAIPVMFPPGSAGIAGTEALPTIWSDPAGFEKAAADYAAAADQLASLAAAGDKAGFAAQWATVRGACNSCHQAYRKPEEQKPS